MPDEMLRRQARTLMWLVTIPFAALSLLTLLLAGNIVLQGIWRGAGYAEQIAVGVLIYYLPMLVYIWAIWMVRQALRAVAEGDVFGRVVPALLARVGIALFCGAVLKEVGVPLLSAAVSGRPYLQTFEPSAITLAAIGVSLVLFAHLLARAATMRDELAEFL